MKAPQIHHPWMLAEKLVNTALCFFSRKSGPKTPCLAAVSNHPISSLSPGLLDWWLLLQSKPPISHHQQSSTICWRPATFRHSTFCVKTNVISVESIENTSKSKQWFFGDSRRDSKKLIENSLGRNMMEHDRTIVINISKLLLFRQAWQMTPTWVSVTSIIDWVISSSKQSCCPRNSWPNFSMASHTDRGSLLAVLSTYCNNLISCAMVRWQLAGPSSLFLNMAIFWELIILSEIRPCQG